MFFAPDRVKKRNHDWGAGGLEKHLAHAWTAFNASVDGWMKIVEGRGEADVERVYRAMVAGEVRPEEGHILSL
jgi:hypothetical protein